MSRDFQLGNTIGEEQYLAIQQYLKSTSYKINEKLYRGLELTDDEREYISNLDDALKGFADPNMISSEVNRVVNRVEKKKLFKKG